MLRLRDVLSPEDLAHFRKILGEEDSAKPHSATQRRIRVSRIVSDDTYLAEQALPAFRALSQADRERLLSDVVWQVTCYVEGSITQGGAGKKVRLECGFKLVKLQENDRAIFCVAKPAPKTPG
jgi:hypothetical protein